MNYPNPPIREAVFDIRVEPINIDDEKGVKEFRKNVKNNFPDEKILHKYIGMFEFSPDGPKDSQSTRTLAGKIFLTKDETRQIQIRSDGLTLNVLKPYEKWEVHFEQFFKLWQLYQKLFKPKKIERIATRFINKIEIPFPVKDFDEYITIAPKIPTGLPQAYLSFFVQLEVPFDDVNGRMARITETIEAEVDSKLPLIIDVDVFQIGNLDNTTENIRANFIELRKAKNSIFESCITDKTREMFYE